MHPRHVHYTCDFCLFIPFIGIFLSVFFTINNLDTDILIIKELFENWNLKPLHILQPSKKKTCHELGMFDIINYEWPGTIQGCYCENKDEDVSNSTKNSYLYAEKCNENQYKRHCKNIDSLVSYKNYKWKDNYLCAASIFPKNIKNYFDTVRIKESDFCAYKTKKCGIIDTLNNYLCIPENENCPINEIKISSNDESNFELITSNNNINDGHIYTSFFLGDNNLCINHNQKDYLNTEKNYALFNKTFAKNFLKCKQYSSNGTKITYDSKSKLFDRYSKYHFYKQNGIYNHIKYLPNYPDIGRSTVGLYGNVYIGWKKDCEKKEFFNYINDTYQTQNEIDTIININKLYKNQISIITGTLCLIFIVGIISLKYKMILTTGNKVEIDPSSFIFCLINYLSIGGLCGYLAYVSNICLKAINQTKINNNFFELVYNNNCSDQQTNFILKYISEEYFSYSNKYFNIKSLSIIEIAMCILIIIYTYFAKKKFDYKKSRKERSINFFDFE